MVTILLLNQQTLVREAWVSFLAAQRGIEVVGSTGDAADACKIAASYRPRITIIALKLDQPNALQQLAWLHQTRSGTRIVLIAPYFPDAVLRRSEKLGVRAWLSTDSSLEELSIAVKRINAGFTHVSQTIETMEEAPDGWEYAAARLTVREWQIACLLRVGKTSKEVAGTLDISRKTIEVHRKHILDKLGCKNTVQLVNRLTISMYAE